VGVLLLLFVALLLFPFVAVFLVFVAAHWDRRLSSRLGFGTAQCRAKDVGNRENPSNPNQIHPS
jgi:hypothetical protein